MRTRTTYLATLVGAAAAAAAIAVAPTAAAAPGLSQPNCTANGVGSVCQSPGNVQINDAPPPVSFYPYGGEAFLL